jgi:hypothetical protein
MIVFVSLVAPASTSFDTFSAGLSNFDMSYTLSEQFTQCTLSWPCFDEVDCIPLTTNRVFRDAAVQTPGQVPEKTSTAGPVI